MRCWRSIPTTDKVERIDVGGSPHWIAVSHATGKLFASFKTKEAVAVVDTEVAPRDRHDSDSARRRRHRGFARRRDAVRLRALEGRGARLRRAQPRASPHASPSKARPARPTSSAACGCRRTAATSARPRMSIISPPSTRPTRSSRSPASPRRRRPWASASPPTACTPICAATTPRSRWNSSCASGRITRQFPTAAGCEFVISY